MGSLQRVSTASGDYIAETLQFYDGLGRAIQTKKEDIGWGSSMVVTDTRYDALGRVTATSQPRQTTSTWDAFIVHPATATGLHRQTTTTYDALGRPLVITAPDGSTTSYGRWVGSGGLTTATYDAKNHVIVHDVDALGRLRTVFEYRGNNGSEGAHAIDATTSYWYGAKDQLVTVSDQFSNITNLYYDAMGRKTTMSDPDMGTWNYYYNGANNLVTQTDARNVSTNFYYDALNRLARKSSFASGHVDTFNSNNTSAWASNGNQAVPFNDGGNNVWRNIGNGASYTGMWRTSSSLQDGRGMTMRFKVDSQNTDAHFMLENNDSTYRRFSVRMGNGTIYGHYTTDGVNWVYPGNLLTNVQLNTWYVLRFLVDDRGGFIAEVYQENNPTIRGSYRAPMTPGKTWAFKHISINNTTYVDSYREYGLGDAWYSYDETWSTNGKGRRTSMCSDFASDLCGSWQDWRYDGRGRVTQTGIALDGITQQLNDSYDSGDRQTSQMFTGGEQLTYTYDSAGRPVSTCTSLGGCYISSASHNALGQPTQRVAGSGGTAVTTNWTYSDVTPYNDNSMKLKVLSVTGPSSSSLVNLSYGYDLVGNITSIVDATSSFASQTQTFTYDHRDRLKTGVTSGNASGSYNQTYTYNAIGNLTSKTGTGSYVYPAGGQPRPHAATTIGGNAYTYDANGNMLRGGGRTIGWQPDNHPLSVTSGGVTEWYRYDGDGNRIQRTRAGASTFYFHGQIEQDATTTRKYYSFGGQTIAMRDSAAGVSYLHGDHLGSASVSTNASGVLTSWQRFDPWGKVRASSSTMPTKRNFTGQYLDDTGLLFYNARYYDPGIGRFVSADSIVPGNASGGMAGIAYKPLTVDFHENGFVAAVNRENQFGPWFTLSDDAKQQLGVPWGPANPQALNRYSSVLNGPLTWTDPSGHTWYMDFTTANQLEGALREFAAELSMPGNVMTGISALGALAGLITKSAGLGAAAVAAIVEATIAAATAALPLIAGLLTVNYVAGIATELADMIDKANQPGADGMAYGIAVQFNNGYLYAMNRATGQIYSTSIPFWMSIPGYLAPGIYHSFQKTLPVNSYYFWNDRNAVPWSPSICWPGRGVCQKHGEPMQ